MFVFWGDGSQEAMGLVDAIRVRSTENFNWTFIFILAVVFYVYWTEFHNKYSGPMRAFLRTHYPTVEADDVIQEVLIALMKCLPHYQYVPDEHGYFHNYLMGIVKHKAEDALRHMKFRTILISELEKEAKERMKHLRRPDDEAEEAAWQNNTKEAALQQLLADSSILPSTREIFRHVAVMHEKPADVASKFGISRPA